MLALAAIFWNRNEQRLRAFWRIGLHFLVMICAVGTWQACIERANGTEYVSRFGTLLIAALTIGAACFVLDRRRIGDLGLRLERAWWLECLGGIALAVALLGAILACEWWLGWIRIQSAGGVPFGANAAWGTRFATLLYYIVVGIVEECYFRGYLLKNVAEGIRGDRINESRAMGIAAIVTALGFAAAHAPIRQSTPLSGVNTLIAGVLLASLVFAGNRLGGAIGFHIGWNYILGGVFGLAVSGDEQTLPWLAFETVGPTHWTGGAYGPEGGLLGTLAFTAGLLLVRIYAFRGRSRANTKSRSHSSQTRITSDG